jgi:hypothetical protein
MFDFWYDLPPMLRALMGLVMMAGGGVDLVPDGWDALCVWAGDRGICVTAGGGGGE